MEQTNLDQKYKFYVHGELTASFETAQEAMEFGNAYFQEGYTIKEIKN
jgi:hypothetical protein